MGDSSSWLKRSLSQPISYGNEEEHCYRALTSSASFGRYASDLDWGKWSCFTQNRCLEEAQKLSKPGSVAAMKAYFETHYKRFANKKNAVVPCQENEVCNRSPPPKNITETHNNSQKRSDLTKFSKDVSLTKEKDLPSDGVVFSIDAKRSSVVTRENGIGSSLKERAGVKIEQFVSEENSTNVDSLKRFGNGQKHSNIGFTEEKKTLLKDTTDIGDLTSLSARKRAISSSKSSMHGSASKSRAPGTPTIVNSRKDDSSTPKSNKTPKDTMEKIRSPFESLQRSISCASCSGAANKTSSPILDSIRNSRIVKSFGKSPKDGSTRQASDRACSRGVATTHNSKTPNQKNMSTVESQSAGRKTPSSTVFSSFSFRCEDRAAKHKEKLENKFTKKETEKVPLLAKSKISPTRTHSRRIGRNPSASQVQDFSSSRPPWRFSAKTDSSKHITEKSRPGPNYSISTRPKKEKTCL